MKAVDVLYRLSFGQPHQRLWQYSAFDVIRHWSVICTRPIVIIQPTLQTFRRILESFYAVTARFGGVRAIGYNSAKSEPIWMKFGALLST